MKIGAGPNEWPRQADDQVSCYVKATPKKVAAYEATKLVTDFDPAARDENTDYYIAKLDDLLKKFGGVISSSPAATQGKLGALVHRSSRSAGKEKLARQLKHDHGRLTNK